MLRRFRFEGCAAVSLTLLVAACDNIHPVVLPTVAPTTSATPTPSPTAVNTPTPTPIDPLVRGCTQTGGTVTTIQCCASVSDFPDMCAIGACGCAPSASHEIRICDCGPGKCFDGDDCVGQLSSAEACRVSGGTTTTGPCCISAGDFPDTCGIGACGCAPGDSRTAQLCTCPAGQCFDGQSCIAR